MKAAGKSLELFRYDAEHAFVNEQRQAVHDREAAELAWGRATEFFKKHLGRTLVTRSPDVASLIRAAALPPPLTPSPGHGEYRPMGTAARPSRLWWRTSLEVAGAIFLSQIV